MVGNARFAPQQEKVMRPGSPIASRSDEKLRADQLLIFQSGSASEQGLGVKVDMSLNRSRSYFQNKNTSLQILANGYWAATEDDDDPKTAIQNPDERDESKSLSWVVRATSSKLQAMNSGGGSLRGPSFRFSSGRLNMDQNSRAMSSCHQYMKVQGSLNGSREYTSMQDSTRLCAVDASADREDSDDDGSLESSDDEEESDASSSDSESGQFKLHSSVINGLPEELVQEQNPADTL